MDAPQSFFQQLYKDFAWIAFVIFLLLLAVANHIRVSADDSYGPASNFVVGGFIFYALVLFVIWSNREMRAKRGLQPVRWFWQK